MAGKKSADMGEPDARLALARVHVQLTPELLEALDGYAAARSLGSRSVAARAALAGVLGVELPVELATGVRGRKYANPALRAAAARRRFTTRAGRVSEILQAVTGGPVTQAQRAAVVAGFGVCGNCGAPLLSVPSSDLIQVGAHVACSAHCAWSMDESR